MKYSGSCHCGKVAYEVEGEIDSAMACNCSMCRRKGSLLWFVTKDKFTLKTPDGNASTYLFNKHKIRHRFCPVCGIHPYAEAVNPKTGAPTAAINIRCLEGVDPDKVKVTHFDGASI
ncbi:GFA family protein [Ramlibacter sp. PS4R-6]|uniref:GFA family protein n=1 Tax=Ramlibacter sp. PS4R-6 TaxID=3133438 RepID=UPI0030A42EE0